MGSLLLRKLAPEDEPAFMAIHRQLEREGFTFALGRAPDMSWGRYLQRLALAERGRDLEPGHVPSTFRLAEVEGVMVGRVSIRHELNEFLAHEGGHIGYGVAPDQRRRGYATEILGQALGVARSVGVGRVLVTCDDTNVGSATVIERSGGILDGVVVAAGGNLIRRYWID